MSTVRLDSIRNSLSLGVSLYKILKFYIKNKNPCGDVEV